MAARQGCRLRGSPRERMLRRLHFFGLPSACLDAAEDDRAEAPAAADGGGGGFVPPACSLVVARRQQQPGTAHVARGSARHVRVPTQRIRKSAAC